MGNEPTVDVEAGNGGEQAQKQIEERPKADEKFGLFFSPESRGGGGFYVPMHPLKVGPGEPGPGDEWHVPTEPGQAEDDVALERVRREGMDLLPSDRADKR